MAADDSRDRRPPLLQLLGRMGLPTEQLASVQEQIQKTLMPQEQIQAMRDLMSTFSPSMDQLALIANQLEAQRSQLEAMMAQLDEMEATFERLTATAEQLVAMQEPWQRMQRVLQGDLSAWRGDDGDGADRDSTA